MTTTRRRLVHGAATAVLLTLSLAACGDSNDSEPSSQEDAMYCELIDPETVQPIVGGAGVKDFGGPVAKSDTRTIKCNLYDEDRREDVLAVYEYEVASSKLAAERDKATDLRTKHVDDEHYVALDEGDDIGYAWYTGDTAAASLVTEARNISVTIPATPAQAAEFTPLALKIAQQIDTNLDTWDAEHPS